MTGHIEAGSGESVARAIDRGGPEIEILIKPRHALSLEWGELWSYRELFYFLAWRDIKVRYRQTVFGAAWAILQPFVTMVLFTLVFNHVGGMKSGGIPYPLFSYSALVVWQLFATGASSASNSLVTDKALVTRNYFPRLISPLAAASVSIVDFACAVLVLVPLMAYYGFWPQLPTVLLIFPALVLTFVFLGGFGTLCASLNVRYRDVRYVLPFVIQAMLFLTPVIYPVERVPVPFRDALYLDPITGAVQLARRALVSDGVLEPLGMAISSVSALMVALVALAYFRRSERTFADLL